jgi:hypothetical protein
MTKKRSKTRKRGVVEKIIKPPHPSVPEKAQIAIEGADELYKEIRVENVLEDETGEKVKLKEHAPVEVVIEADAESTTPKNHKTNEKND